MIYPTFGTAMIAHIAVVASKKAKEKIETIRRIFLSLVIATIIEVILILVLATSFLAITAGFKSPSSNLNIIKNLFF